MLCAGEKTRKVPPIAIDNIIPGEKTVNITPGQTSSVSETANGGEQPTLGGNRINEKKMTSKSWTY